MESEDEKINEKKDVKITKEISESVPEKKNIQTESDVGKSDYKEKNEKIESRADKFKTEKRSFKKFNTEFFNVDKMRQNPWIFSSIVLTVLVLWLIFSGNSSQVNNGNVVSKDIAAEKLVDFVKSQSNTLKNESELEVISKEKEGQLYKITLKFQGQIVPVYVSLDGNYLITDIVPLESKVDESNKDTNSVSFR